MHESLATESSHGNGWDEVIVAGDLKVYPDAFRAELGGKRLPLTNKEFHLLLFFVRNPDRLLRRELIAEAVWDGKARGRTIDIHVARIRAHLPEGAIETVVRLGYRLVLA